MSDQKGLDVLFLSTVMAFKDEMGLKNLTAEDALILMGQFKKMLHRLDRDKDGLVREWVNVDGRGRVVIPELLRNILGIMPGDSLYCRLYSERDLRGLILTKDSENFNND